MLQLVTESGLIRGEALLDYAFREPGSKSRVCASDIVGLVAAYVDRWGDVSQMEDELRHLLSHDVAASARAMFEAFQGDNAWSLWTQGPAIDDIVFKNDKLRARYPKVGSRWNDPRVPS